MSSESNHNPRNSNPNRQSGSSGVYNANPQRSMFFRDLPYSFNNSDLRQLCESEGLEVEDAHVVLNGGRKTLQYGYVLFRTEADAQRAQERLHNRRVLGRDIRVCEFNRESNGESSKDGKVMVSFKCSQSSIPLITEQTVRDIFERKFNHALTSVSIRKHQSKPNNGGQSGYGFISFGDEALDNEVVSTVKKVEIDGIFFDCTRSNGQSQSPETQQASAAPLLATRGTSPRASERGSPSDSSSPYAKESSSGSPSGVVPRANIIQTASGSTRSSSTAGVSVHDAHNLRPTRRPNGTSIRNRTCGISDKLREEEPTTNNSQGGKNRQKNHSAEEESFPSFQVMPLQSSQTSSQLHQQQQQQQQMNQSLQYVTSWPIHQSPPTPITTYNVPMPISQPLAVGIPNSSSSTLGQAYPSPTILYAVTSPNMGYTTTYMSSPVGYSLAPATQSTQQSLPMPIQPPAPQSYSPRYAHHNPHAHHHIHHQQPQHIYMTVPAQSPTENGTVATTNGNSNNNSANNSKTEYMASEAQLRYSQQMTAPQQQQQMQSRHRTFSADDNSPTPIGAYYLSPSDSTYHDRASFTEMYSNTNGGSVVGGASASSQGQSSGVSSANPGSFHPTPPISYAPQPVQQQQPSYHLIPPQQVHHPHHHQHMNPTQQHVHHHQYPVNNVPVQTTTFSNPMGTYSFHPN